MCLLSTYPCGIANYPEVQNRELRSTLIKQTFLLTILIALVSLLRLAAVVFAVRVIRTFGRGFSITREMLVSLCDAVLSGQLPPQELSAIGSLAFHAVTVLSTSSKSPAAEFNLSPTDSSVRFT